MIGGGNRAIDHSYAIKNLGLTRRIVCDAREDVASKHAADWGYAETASDYRKVITRKDVDVVVVVLPHSIAGQVVLDALRAGKHVLTEKPICGTVALGRQIVAEADRAGKVCMVSHNYRFDPGVLAVHDAIRAGKIGEPFLAQGRLIGPPFYLALRPDYRTRTEQNPSTVILGNGVHGFDMLRFWFGDPTSISALFRHVVSKKLGGTGEDTGVCRIEFAHGPIASFTVSDGDVSMSAGGWQWDLYGTEGVLKWSCNSAVLLPKHPECFSEWKPGREPVKPIQLVADTSKRDGNQILDGIYQHLLDVIEGRASSRLAASEALQSLAMTLGAVESAYSGGRTVILS